jgi:hypothetical protein
VGGERHTMRKAHRRRNVEGPVAQRLEQGTHNPVIRKD